MNTTFEMLEAGGLDRLGRLNRLGARLKLLRELNVSLSTPDGLRRAVELLLDLALLVGADPLWIDQLRKILGDERVFQLVQNILRFLAGRGDDVRPSALTDLDARRWLDWLPVALQIIALVRQLRGVQ